MKRFRRKNYASWTNKHGHVVDYDIHPGSVLSKQVQWQRSTDGFASMFGPEPDNVNVGVIAPYMVELGLEHEYYYRVEKTRMWVSFGYSDNPAATLAAVKKPVVGVWTTTNFKPLREVKYTLMPDNIMANSLPKENRWQHNDIGDY